MSLSPWANADRLSDGECQHHLCTSCNPTNTTAGCRDPTKNNSSSSVRYYNGFSSNNYSDSNETFWPAVHFAYQSSVQKKRRAAIPGRDQVGQHLQRPAQPQQDCKCSCLRTYAREIQNFANWYDLLPLQDPGSSCRIGAPSQLKALLSGRDSPPSIAWQYHVAAMWRHLPATHRAGFFTDPINGKFNSIHYTPLRTSPRMGNYFRTDNNGPWATSGQYCAHRTCRQSYNILMTDGYWSEGVLIIRTLRSVIRTRTDSRHLGRRILTYWKTDLLTDSTRCRPARADPANWQHLVNFTVGLG